MQIVSFVKIIAPICIFTIIVSSENKIPLSPNVHSIILVIVDNNVKIDVLIVKVVKPKHIQSIGFHYPCAFEKKQTQTSDHFKINLVEKAPNNVSSTQMHCQRKAYLERSLIEPVHSFTFSHTINFDHE